MSGAKLNIVFECLVCEQIYTTGEVIKLQYIGMCGCGGEVKRRKREREKYRCCGKTEARMYFYDYVIEKLGIKSFNESTHIVISSQECGDIDYLIGHHVNPKFILACDIDPIARQAAETWGVEISPYPTIQDTVVWAKNRVIATIIVD